MNISNNISQNNLQFESRKIPRYTYHLTSKRNYDKILEDGFIRQSDSDKFADGIFMFDLNNFFKCWDKRDELSENLGYVILRHIVKWTRSFIEGANELVAIKIPTDNLDKEKLKFRSLNIVYPYIDADEDNTKLLGVEIKNHIAGNTSAESALIFKRRKNAIEYIYKGDIPIESCEKIGNTVNVFQLRNGADFDNESPVKSIMQALLSGTSEGKGVKLLK